MLFDELFQQNNLGKRADMGFKAEAWEVVKERVQAVYDNGNPPLIPMTIQAKQLKTKEANYRSLWRDWRWLKD